jgi:glycerol-3-phosphate acyltransferase PlsY
MVLLVFCKHHRNIQRLLRGEERSFRGGDHGAD